MILPADGVQRILSFYAAQYEPLDGARARLNGREFLMFGAVGYLGLARHPRVVQAGIDALTRYGAGPALNPPLAVMAEHKTLEEKLGRLHGAEAVVLFNSCMAANAAVLTVLAGAGDLIASDALNHASIVDGCRLSRAETVVFPRGDMSALKNLLHARTGRTLVVTDGVFSMDGEIADVPALRALCRAHGAHLFVDDCHAVGVLGERGAGSLDHFGLEIEDTIITGSLSKALGGAGGGYVACTVAVARELRWSARSYIYTAEMNPSQAAMAGAAIDVMQDEPERLSRLRRNARRLRAGLSPLGRVIGEGTGIVPLLTGGNGDALALCLGLADAGIYAPALAYPVVPADQARVRFQASALQSDEDVDRVVETVRTLLH